MKLEDEQAAAWAATLSTETLRRVHGAPLTATNRQAIEAELLERERVARDQAAIYAARAALATISERVVRGTPTSATEAETAALERLARDLEAMAGRLGEP